MAEEHDCSRDTKKLIKKMKCEVTTPPADIADWDGATATERLTQKKLVDNHVNHKARFKEHKMKTFESMLGQCADALKNKMEATVGCEAVEDSDDVTELLKRIENIACKFEGTKCSQGSLHHAHLAFCFVKQQENESNTVFCERFVNVAEAVKN